MSSAKSRTSTGLLEVDWKNEPSQTVLGERGNPPEGAMYLNVMEGRLSTASLDTFYEAGNYVVSTKAVTSETNKTWSYRWLTLGVEQFHQEQPPETLTQPMHHNRQTMHLPSGSRNEPCRYVRPQHISPRVKGQRALTVCLIRPHKLAEGAKKHAFDM